MNMYIKELYSVESDVNKAGNEKLVIALRNKIRKREPSWIIAEAFDIINMRLGPAWSMHSRIKNKLYEIL